MNKYFFIIFFFMLSSCSHLLKEDNFRDECDEIRIAVENNTIEDKLFNSNLEFSLKEKFNFLLGKKKFEKVNKKICYLKVNVEKSEYSVITSESGSVGRVNRKIKVVYNFRNINKNLNNKFTIFYGSDVSKYVYSDYMKNKKEEENNIKNITNRLYFDILSRV